MNRALLVRRIRSDQWEMLKDGRLRALLDSPESFGSSYQREVAFDDAVWMERASTGEKASSGATWVAADPLENRFLGMVTVIETKLASLELVGQELVGMDLVGMWVDPTARGTGLADALVRTAINHAQSVGCIKLHLWVAEPNVRAQQLYVRHGFATTGEVDVLPSNPSIPELRMAVTFAVEE
jgi:ribosomal protein S18 acetylase RimI-like enzyme